MRNSPHKLVTSVLKMLLECTCNENQIHLYHLLNYYTRVTKTENGVFKSKCMICLSHKIHTPSLQQMVNVHTSTYIIKAI